MDKKSEYSQNTEYPTYPTENPPPYQNAVQYPQNTQYPTGVQYPQNAPNAECNVNVTYVRSPAVQEKTSWFERNQKNKPQSNAVGAASLIFLSGGMNLAWTFFEYSSTTHLKISWFIGAIIGALIGSFLTNRCNNKIIFIVAGTFVIIGGILFAAVIKNTGAWIAARYLDGFANGLIFAPALVAAGEIAVKDLRGMIASSIETMCFTLGIYIEMIFTVSMAQDINSSSFSVNQLHGIISIFYGALAILFAFLLVIDSPIYHLMRNDEQTAIDCLRRLQRPFTITTETYEQLLGHKRYIAFNKELPFVETAFAGLPALIKLCFYRGMVALSCSVIMYIALEKSTTSVGSLIWPIVIFSTLRWISILFAVFLMDSVGRKKPMQYGMAVSGVIAFAIGGIFTNITAYTNLTVGMCLIFLYQFFVGIAITPTPAYLSEAFPMAVKSYYIAISFCVEMLVQIITLICTLQRNSLAGYFFALGALSIMFFFSSFHFFPETKKLSLCEAQERFRSWSNHGMQ